MGISSPQYSTYQIRLQTLRQEYNRFSKAAGLRTQTERAEVAGFGHKQASAADKAARGHYKTWSKSIGVDSSIKNLAEYYDVKYNDTARYELLQGYVRAVERGDISPLVGFDQYEEVNRELLERGEISKIPTDARNLFERFFGKL